MTKKPLPQNSEVKLEARDLSKNFGETLALDRLNLNVKGGEIYCLLGANGAGKTTTINLFLNFFQPSSGRALVSGLDVTEKPSEVRARLTYLPEQVALYPEFSGLENLEYLLALSQRTETDRPALKSYLKEAGLSEDSHDRPVGEYSKGMRQKVGVALALAKKSEVLLLDEPTSGLDPASANEFSQIVSRLAEQGAAILMVTHDLFRVKQLSHRFGIMKKGILVSEESTSEVDADELEKLYLRHMLN